MMASTMVTAAGIITVVNLAHTTRMRWGSSVKDTGPVRWLHSLVMLVMAGTGTSNDTGIVMICANWVADGLPSSLSATTSSTMPRASTSRPPVMASSQKPARVSHILRSSTDTRRTNGTCWVEEMSMVGDGSAATAVIPRLLRR
ncbi:hypothetical protein [Nocardioides sp. B-3]|uniref:hypothetical protein n=1 Tax=Nocardioides sp. B-3 TaxID=2895565 RepID=UPI002153304D|nr:hypothetical protein [Nocardioides sp. B-3]UUZ60082.1 hypothetical protein LP418_03620 [Nocardioides sp. B-3]